MTKYEAALECLAVAKRNDTFNLLYAHYDALYQSLQLAQESEQLRNAYTSMGVTLAARNTEIEQLRKERDELAEAYLMGTQPCETGKIMCFLQCDNCLKRQCATTTAKKVRSENGNA